MESTSSAIGLIVIVALYVTMGVMSAAGSVYIAKLIFSAKLEQIFFGLFLIPIAGFYLAFTAYFGDKDAWQLEATAVAVFAVFGLVGVRVASVLIVGYLLHGLWDVVHQFNAHAGGTLLGPRQTTSVPLAYGFFCHSYSSVAHRPRNTRPEKAGSFLSVILRQTIIGGHGNGCQLHPKLASLCRFRATLNRYRSG